MDWYSAEQRFGVDCKAPQNLPTEARLSLARVKLSANGRVDAVRTDQQICFIGRGRPGYPVLERRRHSAFGLGEVLELHAAADIVETKSLLSCPPQQELQSATMDGVLRPVIAGGPALGVHCKSIAHAC